MLCERGLLMQINTVVGKVLRQDIRSGALGKRSMLDWT
jgi:hypothetical protein